MRILSIELKNIKSHRQSRFEFAPGINVLSGPNGAGKSTIFEAVGYALFGVDAQRFVGNIERFLSIGTKKGEISVEFETDSGDRYRVARTVGLAGRWLLSRQVGGVFEVEEHKDGSETEERLKKLLGLDNGRSLAEQFEGVIGPFQNDFLGPFVIKQPTRRRDEFDAVLGIDTWRKTFTATAGLTKAIRARSDVLEAELAIRKEQVSLLPGKKAELQKVTAEFRQATKARDNKNAELKEVETLLRELDGREQALIAAQNELDKLALRLLDGGQKIEAQEVRVREAEESAGIAEASRPGKEAFEKAEARLVDLRRQEKQLRALEKELAGIDRQSAGLKERHEAESRAVETGRREIDREEQRLRQTCRSLLVDEETRASAGRLSAIKQRVAELRNRQGRLAGQRAGLEEGREKLAEGICPFFKEPCLNVAGGDAGDVFSARLDDLDEEQASLAVAMEGLLEEEASAERCAARVREIEVRKQALERELAALEIRRKELGERENGLRELLQRRRDLSAELEERQKGLRGFAGLEQAVEAAEKEQTANRSARDAFYRHAQQAAELAGRRETLDKYRSLLETLKGEQAAQKEALKDLIRSYDKEKHADARRRKEILLGDLGTLGQQLAGLEKDRERLSGEIDKLKGVLREIEEKKAAVARLSEKADLVKFLRNRVFKNVSAHLSERFREEISQRADRIYRTIAETDEELVWGENYRVVLRDMHDGQLRERSDDQLSGGQMMSAVVALRLALLQTIGARIAFFDEPTSNLDVARRENLARAFRAIDVGREEVAEHWYDQLFLISHDISFTEITDQIIPLGEGAGNPYSQPEEHGEAS